jgi:hypothetical protein
MHLFTESLHPWRLRPIVVLLLAVTTSNCAVAPLQMELTPALLHITPMAVVGFDSQHYQKPISFGKWTATPISGALASNLGPNAQDAVRNERSYRLTLAAGADNTAVTCWMHQRTGLSCAFSGALQGTLNVAAMEVAGKREQGQAVFGDRQWSVRSVNHGQGERAGVVTARYGYEIASATRTVAAVQTIDAAQVWLAPTVAAADQEQIAAVVMALLYFDPRTGS